MSHTWRAFALAALLYACSGKDTEPAAADEGAGAGDPGSSMSDTRPLMADGVTPASEANGSRDTGSSAPGSFTAFTDPSTGFATDEVHDADREIVHFDPSTSTMVWGATGDEVSGWTTSAADLSWSRSGVAFQVRFGTEQGERRAYFTERATGTICNLNITAPERLSIFGTNEPPPEE